MFQQRERIDPGDSLLNVIEILCANFMGLLHEPYQERAFQVGGIWNPASGAKMPGLHPAPSSSSSVTFGRLPRLCLSFLTDKVFGLFLHCKQPLTMLHSQELIIRELLLKKKIWIPFQFFTEKKGYC